MKSFNYYQFFWCLIIFCTLGMITQDSFGQRSGGQKTNTTTYKKGDKVEVEIDHGGKKIWVEGSYIQAYQGKHMAQYQFTYGNQSGSGSAFFENNQIRPFTGNLSKPNGGGAANQGGGQATNQGGGQATNQGGGQAANQGGGQTANQGGGQTANQGGGQASNAKPTGYKKGDKLEVEIDYQGKKIWVEGAYVQEYNGKHMAQYQFAYGSGSNFFDANQIRPFAGNLTNLNAGGGGGQATNQGGGNSNANANNGNATGGGAASSNPYKNGDKVEVCLQDCGDASKAYWVEATYDKYVNFSNFKGHVAAWNTGMGSGSKNFEDNHIRKWTGKLKSANLTADVASPASINTSTLEGEVMAEVNRMRKDPTAYANELQEILDKEGDYYIKSMGDNYNFKIPKENPGGYSSTEKAAHQKDIQDLIALLRQRATTQKADASKLKQLTKNNILASTAKTFSQEFTCDAAAKLAKCQAKYPNDAARAQSSANNSHVDCDCNGPMDRVVAAGYQANAINECLYPCGKQTARGIVLGFLIDYGVASKGHRLNLTNEDSTEIGVGSSFDAKTGCIRTVIKCGFN